MSTFTTPLLGHPLGNAASKREGLRSPGSSGQSGGPWIRPPPRRLMGRGLVATLLLMMGIGFTHAADAPRRVLRSADVHPEDYPTVQAVMAMSQSLRQRTNGRLSIQVFHSGLLGDEAPLLDLVQTGKLDMNRISVQALESRTALAHVLSLPYLFRSTEHMHKVMDGPIGDEILDSLEPSGLIGLALYDSGIRNVYNTRKPIERLEDFRNLTLRIQPSAMATAFFSALHARPVPLPYAQTGRALNNRIVDAAENNLPSYASSEHFKAAPYYTLTRHFILPDVLVVSRETWKSLSPADQLALRESARASVAVMRDMWLQREERVEAALKLAGVRFNELQPAELTRLQQTAQTIQARFAADPRQQDLIKRIRAVQ